MGNSVKQKNSQVHNGLNKHLLYLHTQVWVPIIRKAIDYMSYEKKKEEKMTTDESVVQSCLFRKI